MLTGSLFRSLPLSASDPSCTRSGIHNYRTFLPTAEIKDDARVCMRFFSRANNYNGRSGEVREIERRYRGEVEKVEIRAR